ncbi:hypothetical protein FNB79_13910 [Formosa sediminum]|uniref:Uncharacterized protein n=1 Tax=Formosa sediminum TaxID=2594004 RepID=A0A516GU19_9FLAO|nr:hypothetical protein [Formosa sediminum]QDO95019.1 hypothetical protein FNB79_13910 [Formosa sediminum]
MKKVIVDYKKLTPEILSRLTEKFPDGYNDRDIIRFDNHQNETIEAVEITTKDTTYLVKVSCKLHYTMTNFDSSNDLVLNNLGHVVVDFPDYPNLTLDEDLVLTNEEE